MELSQKHASKKSKEPPHSPLEKLEAGKRELGKTPTLKQLHMYRADSCNSECILCNEQFSLPDKMDEMLSHFLHSHHLVIADVHFIADFKGYVDYWRTRLKAVSLFEICSVMKAAVKEAGTNPHVEGELQEFFLLADVLPEDRLLRQGLQQKRLEWVLQQQQYEREDETFSRGCLICRTELTGTRAGYLQHLSSAHNLQLGRAANLVFIDELIEQLEQYFSKFQCIYCNKYFTDRLVMREHMRKKMHKRINPSNHLFDQYYAVNYLEIGKNWQQVAEEPDLVGHTSGSEAAEDDVADWGDWNETTCSPITCLFCSLKCDQWESAMQHLKQDHNFDFPSIGKQLDFYQKVKLVNYIRNQVENNTCFVCEKILEGEEELLKHMEEANHRELPRKDLWDRPEYFFPTKEDDEFLCQMDDGKADDEANPECVTGEEPDPQLKAALAEGRLSEAIELKAELNQPLAVTSYPTNTSSCNNSPSPGKAKHHVKFQDEGSS